MVIIRGTLKIAPDDVEAFRRLALEVLGPSQQEPGCSVYEISEGVDAPDTFHIIEEWDTIQALDDHAATEHLRAFRRGLGRLEVLHTSIDRYEPTTKTVLR